MDAPLIAIMGPTASGKTALAMAICDHLPADVISVDSALVYRGMDIGTAKPNERELARVPHRLIDIVDPSDVYSAGQFRRDALTHIEAIRADERTPVLAGGTMLYFRALLNGIDALPDADPAVRASLDAKAAEIGWPAMHKTLAQIDAVAAARIHANDAQRIQRALEVHQIAGKTLTELQRNAAPGLSLPVIKLGLLPTDRATLHARIEARFDQMLEAGLVEEVRALLARFDLRPDHPALRAVGYRQIAAYLRDETTLAQARLDAITATRRLARRQLTWLRKEEDLIVVESDAADAVKRGLSALIERGVPLQGL
ncbi:MAG: tRNA (adenosine(37)-N6)-dimethylallyltransferase MiaA [Gammaproteobacteria bacterium]